MKLWAVFSIDNDYYQPRNNLHVIYNEKPTFEVLFKTFFGWKDTVDSDKQDIDSLLHLASFKEIRMSDLKYYRLVEIETNIEIEAQGE